MRAAAFQKLAGKIARSRHDLFSVDATGNAQLAQMHPEDGTPDGDAFRCYISSGKSQETLDAMMLFKESHDHVVRVSKTENNCDPTKGKVIKLIAPFTVGHDLFVRIADIQTSALNPEYVLGCKNL